MEAGHVALDEVRIARLARERVVEHVVLVDPRLGDHPVGPVEEAPLAPREDAARVLRGDAGDVVVAAMANVVHQHPARGAAEGEGQGAHRVRAEAGRGEAEGGARAPPALHPAEVVEVPFAERGVDLAPEGADFAHESVEIDA